MPIFEFHCKECRNDFKTLRRLERLSEVSCPSCGTEKVIRMLSVTAQSNSGSDSEVCAMPSGGG